MIPKYSWQRGYSDEEARQVFSDECRNAEKCSICGKARYGHHEEHEFRAKWEIDKTKKREVTKCGRGFIGGYIEDITDAQDIMKEIKKERKENE